MNELKRKLETFCIFRELLSDPVIGALRVYLDAPTPAVYADFVSNLYQANGGNISTHVRELCENSSNVYVRTLCRGEDAPDHMYFALLSELDTLQAVAELTKEKLCGSLDYTGFLPDFANAKLRLRDPYLHRTANICKYGYGIYAKHHAVSY